MAGFFTQFFTWWNGQTLNTRFYTWRKGSKVGEDQFGNVYYTGGTYSDGRQRRWVIYQGYSEASEVPPGWWGWLHHKVDTLPTDEDYKPYEWQKPFEPNLTGTYRAYRPKGSVLRDGERPRVTGDYDAWTPGG